jgi:hypothetical protein
MSNKPRATRKHHDPHAPENGPKYHTGKLCIEPGCDDPAGTAWGPYWCQRHNAERLDRISANLDRMLAEMEPVR